MKTNDRTVVHRRRILQAGAAIGAVTGHIKGGMDNTDLEALGEVLDKGQAGLIVVYATNMADQVAANH